MSEFEIEVEGKKYSGELLTYGYSYRIIVLVNDIPVAFEPDEERNLRAIVPMNEMDKIDKKLLQAIGAELEKNIR